MKIILTATRANEEPHRLKRLEKVVEIYNLSEYFGGNDDVVSLHDHKGLLTVGWSRNPSEGDKQMISAIWALMNELEESVEHVVEKSE
ncbi:hypothetical protein [Flagellimonas onchidii]|uniref:hypothetical protein n=1 Tax=Flagellimonas onchidii TaxID=2562684 RepID=UPI0010A609E3|nr:hypothetical protein [Allomuricauda onchidii]